MKNVIIALTLATAALSFGAKAAAPCEQLVSESPVFTSGKLDEMASKSPEVVSDWRKSIIRQCEAAYTVGKKGLPPEVVAHVVVSNASSADAFSSLLSATSISVSMAAWAAGAESAK